MNHSHYNYFKPSMEAIESWGVINIDIHNDANESQIIKNQFSIRKNTCYKIISRKYPKIICYITDDTQSDIKTKYIVDNNCIPCQNEEEIQKFRYYKNRILFMMVSRKFSLGFIEFIRGKYDISDPITIINLFEQMYENEIKYIKKSQYDDILFYFLNRNNETIDTILNRVYEGKYSNEYCNAKIKFNILLNPTEDKNNDVPYNLYFYTNNIKPKWKNSEWGFPKGRRDKKHEDILACARREFEEETGYRQEEYTVLNKIEPVEENLVGTNGICYRHTYYLAINNRNGNKPMTNHDAYEIGETKWFTYNEAMDNIRPYHVEKRQILTRVYLFMLNYLIHHDETLFED
jgi:8-oxo-dGTP pyrophosphatase MutT (NUDIX family)